jgi:hypothetical protein
VPELDGLADERINPATIACGKPRRQLRAPASRRAMTETTRKIQQEPSIGAIVQKRIRPRDSPHRAG